MRHQLDSRHDDTLDGRDTPWDRFLHDLDELLLDNNYRWARSTVSGIRDMVERTGTVSPRQRQAVKNIVRGLWPIRRRG